MLEGQFKRARRRNVATLADDLDFQTMMHGAGYFSQPGTDEDAEWTYPEGMDQTCLDHGPRRDDYEDDDPDHGIDDCCCDARDEDGV